MRNTYLIPIDFTYPKCLNKNMTKQRGSILNKADYDEIDKRIRDAMDEKISNLPTKKEYLKTMDDLMKEIKGARLDLAAHKSMHEDLDKDIPNLQHKVKHLYKVFEIEEPADVIPAY